MNDKRVVETLSSNPQSFNRLSRLYRALEKYHIELTSELHDVIEKKPEKSGAVADLIDFLMSDEIGLSLVQVDDVKGMFNVCLNNADELFRYAVAQISKKNDAWPDVLKLFYIYPEESSNLSDLVIEMWERAYDSKKLISSLEKAYPITNFGDLIRLLTDIIRIKNRFYFPLVDILLKQTSFLSDIQIGAKLLAEQNGLSDEYFEVIGEKSKNSILIAKTIILLKNKSLIDHANKKDLLMCCQINKDAFSFLKQLDLANKLNENTYKLVLNNSCLFLKDRSLMSLSKNSLFFRLSNSKIENIIKQLSFDNQFISSSHGGKTI